MSAIIDGINKVSEAREALAAVETEISEAIGPELQAKLEAAQNDVKAAEKSVREAAKKNHRGKRSFAGVALQLVYQLRITYPKAKLEEVVPERYLSQVRKETEVWQIQKVKAE